MLIQIRVIQRRVSEGDAWKMWADAGKTQGCPRVSRRRMALFAGLKRQAAGKMSRVQKSHGRGQPREQK